MKMLRTRFARALPVAVALAATPAVHAAFVPQYTGTTTSGSTTTYDYTFYFIPSYSGETLTSGDFVTLYDVGEVLGATAAGTYTYDTNATGTTAPGTTPTDSASITNLTYIYNGVTLTAAASFTATLTVFTNGNVAHTGQFTSTDTTLAGKIGQIGPLTLPTPARAPEPATLAALAAGAAGLLRRRRA